MLKLAKELGSEVDNDPSLLHPLVSRLPPLYADTPSNPVPPSSPTSSSAQIALPGNANGDADGSFEEPNPFQPIPISRILSLAEGLLARFPFNGDVVRGTQIMGKDSAINTYTSDEQDARADTPDTAQRSVTLQDLEQCVDRDVILPGASEPDDEPSIQKTRPRPSDALARSRRRWLFRRSLLSMRSFSAKEALAFGVVVIGVGIAFYSLRGPAGGARAGWAGWWASITRSWVRK